MPMFTQDSVLPESPEAAQIKRERDREFAARGETANFKEAADGAKDVMGGMGELSPEESRARAKAARDAEMNDREPEKLISSEETRKNGEDTGVELASIERETGEKDPDAILDGFDTPVTSELDTGEISQKGEDILVGSIGDDVLENNTEEENRKKDESIYTPHIKQLEEAGMIISDQSAELITHGIKNKNFRDISKLPSFDGISRTKISYISDYLGKVQGNDDIENNPEQLLDFTKDFGETFKNNGIDISIDGRDKDTSEMIGLQYFKLPGEDSISQKQAVDGAFGTALNVLIDGKQFERTVEYKELSSLIKNSKNGFVDRFNAFKELIQIIDVSQAKGGEKDKKLYAKNKAEGKLYTAKLYDQFMTGLQSFKNATKNSQEYRKLAQELEIMRKTAGLDPAEATMLAGGEMDIASDKLNETPQKIA